MSHSFSIGIETFYRDRIKTNVSTIDTVYLRIEGIVRSSIELNIPLLKVKTNVEH